MFLVILILLSACASFADTLPETTRPCRIERLDHAYALCVDALSDARELAMHDAVGQTLGSLQAATPEELGELAQAVRKGTREQQLHEFGDVLAWLASLANQMDIQLDDAMQRYVENPP